MGPKMGAHGPPWAQHKIFGLGWALEFEKWGPIAEAYIIDIETNT